MLRCECFTNYTIEYFVSESMMGWVSFVEFLCVGRRIGDALAQMLQAFEKFGCEYLSCDICDV